MRRVVKVGRIERGQEDGRICYLSGRGLRLVTV